MLSIISLPSRRLAAIDPKLYIRPTPSASDAEVGLDLVIIPKAWRFFSREQKKSPILDTGPKVIGV
jgi:hypothetical protein